MVPGHRAGRGRAAVRGPGQHGTLRLPVRPAAPDLQSRRPADRVFPHRTASTRGRPVLARQLGRAHLRRLPHRSDHLPGIRCRSTAARRRTTSRPSGSGSPGAGRQPRRAAKGAALLRPRAGAAAGSRPRRRAGEPAMLRPGRRRARADRARGAGGRRRAADAGGSPASMRSAAASTSCSPRPGSSHNYKPRTGR